MLSLFIAKNFEENELKQCPETEPGDIFRMAGGEGGVEDSRKAACCFGVLERLLLGTEMYFKRGGLDSNGHLANRENRIKDLRD